MSGSWNVAILIAAVTGSGSASVAVSGIRDLRGYVITCRRLGVKEIHIITDGIGNFIWQSFHPVWLDCHIHDSISALPLLMAKAKGRVLVTLSGHGYDHNYGRHHGQAYTIFNHVPVSSHSLTAAVALLRASASCLIVCDTCHSESLFNMDDVVHPNMTCIAACRDGQSTLQGVSEEFGYGGGLTVCILDRLCQRQPDAEDLFRYAHQHLTSIDQHPCISHARVMSA